MTFRVTFTTLLFSALTLFITSCADDEMDTMIIDSSQPMGSLSVDRSGSLVAENGTPTSGTVELGSDEDGATFVRLGSNFTTDLGTGTLSLYFSTSDTFTADPMNGNPDLILVGIVTRNGEQFFKLDAAVPNEFTHVILWCNSASIPFGNAQLQ